MLKNFKVIGVSLKASPLQLDSLPSNQPIALHILTTVSGNGNNSFVENFFEIRRWLQNGRICGFGSSEVSSNVFDLASVLRIHRSIDRLVETCLPTTKPFGLEAKTITNFVEDFLAKGFYPLYSILNLFEPVFVQGTIDTLLLVVLKGL